MSETISISTNQERILINSSKRETSLIEDLEKSTDELIKNLDEGKFTVL
jgi:hypothetical protein